MGGDSDILSDKELFLKNRLEVKLNDLEKKHLETKEREAQTVGFLERRLKQVELEHKMELKLRRQLRYEVNNLRKRLLETYKLYSDTLEQNEIIKKELEALKNKENKKESVLNTKLDTSREISIVIKEHDYEFIKSAPVSFNTGSENERCIQRNRMNFVTPNNSARTRSFFTPLEYRTRNSKNSFIRSGGSYTEKSFTRNTVYGSGSCNIGGDNINYGQKDSLIKSERAKDWLKHIEELYKPSENKADERTKYREEKNISNLSSILRVEDSLSILEDISSEDKYFSGEDITEDNDLDEDINFDDFVANIGRKEGIKLKEGKYIADNTEMMVTNTELIIDQINQQDKELSSLLQKANICNNSNIGSNVNVGRISKSSGNRYKGRENIRFLS
ncbi:hypothetical protein FG379_001237 [Cryptosporidium bovis]|uniref:uncharacterized protein n=1 Tax=Cryptosporidium bovis TaxID=310047 RepID=UPI00351AA21D|nr:hypothetical protein FG379_001237 [Cryptosporidium bovis]